MSSSFISLSRTPEVLQTEVPSSSHGHEVSQSAPTLIVPPPPRRRARPRLAPGVSVPPPPPVKAGASPTERATASAPRKAATRKPTTLPVVSEVAVAKKPAAGTDNHWEVDLKELREQSGDGADDDLDALDFEAIDWETAGMRLRRHARRLFGLAARRRH